VFAKSSFTIIIAHTVRRFDYMNKPLTWPK